MRIPGPASRKLAERLSRVESRNVTFLSERFPVFWERAEGSQVWDADGNRYVDLTAGFGVAAVGHAHPRVVAAIRSQAERLCHGMGDVHPPAVKVRLLERLARLSPQEDARVVLACSGSEAVEVALKTACLFTGKPGCLAFTGAYHGLTYGALSVTDRAHFRAPFERQLNPHVARAPYPHPLRRPERLAARLAGAGGPAELLNAALEEVEAVLDAEVGRRVGAVIVEPIQGRGGEVVPPPGWLAALADLCRERGLLLIADEIFTGFGRTGTRFACEAEGVVPDLLCVGKALSSSMPLSACIGRGEVMEAWPRSTGEAMHTSTFLGHPLGCAAALASTTVIEEERLAVRAREEGGRWLEALRLLGDRHECIGDVRGRGLMIGVELVEDRSSLRPAPRLAGRAVLGALGRGWILLGGAPEGNVLSLSPPLNVDRKLLDRAVAMLDEVLAEAAGGA
ncbi:MAG: aspartate aminotransferase family protein [Gemmatimonadota bacterium]